MTFNCDKMANQYPKRQGTSCIRGPLYESKLLSLIYFRAIHDNNIEEFHLATNVNNLGSFDDICFKTKFEDNDKPLAVFVQAKHRENNDSVLKLKESDLVKYFNSYLKVRRKFNCNEKDVLFNSTLNETECLFVIYTNAKCDKMFRTYEGRFSKHLNNLIGTGVPGSQFSHDMNVELLCEILLKEQVEALAQQLAKFISKESDSEMSMNNDHMSCYHVILALNVFDVSEIQPEGHRIASFREDFFTTNDEYITPFKHKLCLGVLKKQKLEDIDTQRLLLTFLKNPSDVDTLSKLLIGSVLKYKSDKLEFVSKSVTGDQKRQLDKANVLQSTVYEAAELATKEYLLSLKLKVPAFFGNKDLAIRGNENKIQKRLDHLTTKIKEILKQSNPHHIVTIDGDEESMEGILQLNGGIASAVGNILVFDETSKLLKFTDTYESLGKLAKTWYETLTSEIPNLHEYRLDIKAKLFPKLSFATDEYNRTIVSSFLNTILFFTSQHNEKEVEKVLKQEIINSQGDDVHVKNGSDAIYLKYHDEIQRWSMESDLRKGTYLDKEGFIYKDAVKHVKTQPLMGVINTIKLIDMSAELQKQILENNKVSFQGNEVNLGHFLNNSSIDYIGGDVLYNIMNGNKNTVGKPVSTFKFKPELYIQRRVRPFCRDTKKQENVDCKQIQTLSNLEENVTIIFGDPGMGKSSLLTDFSLKMKEGVRGNTTWIVRVNLLEHTAQFKKWKDKNTKIGTTESLEFLCEVAISDVSRQTMDMNISLVESDDGTVLMTDFKGDAWTLFELRMFLNFYNSAQLIILLDGFDEICPTYENEVLALIEAVRKFSRTHKICITSRSDDKLVKIFENLEYCKLIEIEPLIVDESDIYLSKCWDEKKVLNDLNENQVKNICDCIWFVSKSTHTRYVLSKTFGVFYKDCFELLDSKMPYIFVGLSLIKYIIRNRLNMPAALMEVVDRAFTKCCYIEPKHVCLATPLDLNIVADYLFSQIKKNNIKEKDEWDWDYAVIGIYKYYLERKLRISFLEKNQTDLSKPNNISAYHREYSKSLFGKVWLLLVFFEFIFFKLKLGEYRRIYVIYSYLYFLTYLYVFYYYVFVSDWMINMFEWFVRAYSTFGSLFLYILFFRCLTANKYKI